MKKIALLFFFYMFCYFIYGQNQNAIQVLEEFPARGCENLRVLRKVKFEGKQNTFVILDIDANKFKLTNKFLKFKLDKSPSVKGVVEILNTEETDNYCTDALKTDVKILQSLKIESGTISVRKVREEKKMEQFNHIPYIVDVVLENAWFKKDGKKHFIKKIIFKDVLVSYLIG